MATRREHTDNFHVEEMAVVLRLRIMVVEDNGL